jgi:hypothetical protein
MTVPTNLLGVQAADSRDNPKSYSNNIQHWFYGESDYYYDEAWYGCFEAGSRHGFYLSNLKANKSLEHVTRNERKATSGLGHR